MSSHSYLVCQASTRTYFFRSYIPQNLVKHFDGRQEFRLSLGCKSKIRSHLASNHLSDIVCESVHDLYLLPPQIISASLLYLSKNIVLLLTLKPSSYNNFAVAYFDFADVVIDCNNKQCVDKLFGQQSMEKF